MESLSPPPSVATSGSSEPDAPAVPARRAPLVATRLGPGTAGSVASPEAGTGRLFGTDRGLLALSTADGQWVVPPGHVAWVPSDVAAEVVRHGPFTGVCVAVTPAAGADLRAAVCVARWRPLLHAAVDRVCAWSAGPPDAAAWRLAAVVLDELAALPAEPRFALPLPAHPALRGVARAQLARVAHDPGLAGWAAQAGMAPRTFTRQHLLETGLAPADWRQRARLLHALVALADGQPPPDVAAALGYDSVRAFTAMFRRETGRTPARYFDEAGPAPSA